MGLEGAGTEGVCLGRGRAEKSRLHDFMYSDKPYET